MKMSKRFFYFPDLHSLSLLSRQGKKSAAKKWMKNGFVKRNFLCNFLLVFDSSANHQWQKKILHNLKFLCFSFSGKWVGKSCFQVWTTTLLNLHYSTCCFFRPSRVCIFLEEQDAWSVRYEKGKGWNRENLKVIIII